MGFIEILSYFLSFCIPFRVSSSFRRYNFQGNEGFSVFAPFFLIQSEMTVLFPSWRFDTGQGDDLFR